MKNEEQLNRYFEHGMTGAEEQNFLISVAASDELRRAFRSQLELIKAVRSDKDALHSGRDGEPVARVRDRTLAALGLSATAAAPFMNGDPSHALSEPVVAKMEAVPAKAFWSTRLLGTSSITLATGLALGVLSTIGIQRLTAPATSASGMATPIVSIPAPAAQTANPTAPSQAIGRETIPAENGLVHGANHAVHTNHDGLVATHREAVQTAAKPAPSSIPMISTSQAGTMHSNKIKIKNPNDTGTGNR